MFEQVRPHVCAWRCASPCTLSASHAASTHSVQLVSVLILCHVMTTDAKWPERAVFFDQAFMRVLRSNVLAQRTTGIESSLAVAGYHSSLPTDDLADVLCLVVPLPSVHTIVTLESVDLPASVLLSAPCAQLRHNEFLIKFNNSI